MAKELKVKVEGTKGVIAQVSEKCRYGSVSFPSSIDIEKWAQAHPNVKSFEFEGTSLVCDSDLAHKTLGTWVTKANKIANGVDPELVNPTGSRGGGSRVKVAVRLEGKSVVFTSGEAVATATKEVTTFDSKSTAGFASKVMRVVESMRAGSDEALKPLLGKPRLVAKLDTLTAELGEGEINDEVKAKATGAIAILVHQANRFDLFSKLADIKVEAVGGEASGEYLKLFA